jgi:signal transduction histidine kinase
MFLLALVMIGSVCGAFALAVIHADRVSGWLWALPQRLRGRGWGLLLLPAAAMAAAMAGGAHALAVAELVIAGALVIGAPRLAAKLAPYAVLALAAEGVILAKSYHDGFNSQVLYGLVLAGAGSWRTRLVLPEAALLFVFGVWLLMRVQAPGSTQVRALIARWLDPGRSGISPWQGLLLLPVVAMVMQLLGPVNWFGAQSLSGLDVAALDLGVATAALVLVFRSRVWAATLAEAGLLVMGGYGLLIAFGSAVAVPGFTYGLPLPLLTPLRASALEGTVLLALGLWLAPRVMREHLPPPADPELAARAQQLTQRVQTLTRTRSDAVDTAAAELRRIERDLHDGAQARLVAVGMSLQAAERLFASNPEAALALVAEARENSARTGSRSPRRWPPPPSCSRRWWTSGPTWGSWTCGCRPRTPTTGCAPPCRPAARCPACRCWSCPSTWSSSTPASCSPTRPGRSATCSRTASSTTRRSPRRSAPWRPAAPCWTPRWCRS